MASAALLWLLLLAPFLFQVPLALYLRRQFGGESPSVESGSGERSRRSERRHGDGPRAGTGGATLTCPYCGAANGGGFEFCERCVGRLR